MKREAKRLLGKASDALVMSIELFNRPHDRGRVSGTLIELDHGFEMLLKAAILHRGGPIREKRAAEGDRSGQDSVEDGERGRDLAEAQRPGPKGINMISAEQLAAWDVARETRRCWNSGTSRKPERCRRIGSADFND